MIREYIIVQHYIKFLSYNKWIKIEHRDNQNILDIIYK